MPEALRRLPAWQAKGAREGDGVTLPAARRPAAVLFDCDGVLADSEGLVNRIVAEDLTARGWRLSAAQARETFLGIALPDMLLMIEARVGPLPPRWSHNLSGRISDALLLEVEPVPGAVAALRVVAEAGLPVAVASNSSRSELRAKLARLELTAIFGARVFSFEDVVEPKPAPDIYRAAAAACGAPPEACVVVEDSLLGARAGIAAGFRVLGLARETAPEVLAAVGAEPFLHMQGLPALLGLGRAAA
jgi:HAD superfamily hydrolase (TIGR01509 family)